MGYYSSVMLTTTNRGFNVLKHYCEDLNLEYNMLDHCDRLIRGDRHVCATWDWTKWYDTFPEIRAIEDGLRFLSDMDISYSFTRIGEEVDDIENDYNYGNDDADLPYNEMVRCYDIDEMERLITGKRNKYDSVTLREVIAKCCEYAHNLSEDSQLRVILNDYMEA